MFLYAFIKLKAKNTNIRHHFARKIVETERILLTQHAAPEITCRYFNKSFNKSKTRMLGWYIKIISIELHFSANYCAILHMTDNFCCLVNLSAAGRRLRVPGRSNIIMDKSHLCVGLQESGVIIWIINITLQFVCFSATLLMYRAPNSLRDYVWSRSFLFCLPPARIQPTGVFICWFHILSF